MCAGRLRRALTHFRCSWRSPGWTLAKRSAPRCLGAVGVTGPDLVMVLAERWGIARKLHAVTDVP